MHMMHIMRRISFPPIGDRLLVCPSSIQLVRVLIAFLLPLSAGVVSHRADGAEFHFGSQTINGADGFVVEQIAAPPLIDRPLTFDFDERGRLYVANSSGSNAAVEKQLSEPSHQIIRLEDRNGDGAFDARTVFADRLMLPQGTMWFAGSLYVAAPPQIWRLTDHDDDGVAESREVWFDGGTLTGCANDVHGPYLGRDGWFYWCKGAFAQQTYDLPGRQGWKTRAAHIFRARPDGTGVEPVLSGGMDNPVDVVMTARGERILSSTFLTHPRGGLRDGLIHALYGGLYGKEHGVLNGHVRTGDLLSPLVHMGPAAVCGLHVHSGFSGETGSVGDLFACSFNLRKVSRHHLSPSGSTFVTTDSNFLESDSADFHPTDVLEDADGSLLVADTGGWYKLCCPTSQIEKPAKLGAIYRIHRKDAVAVADPRGLRIDWLKLSDEAAVEMLSDNRPAVVSAARNEIVRRGPTCLKAIAQLLGPDTAAGTGRKAGSADARREAVWTLSGIIDPEARQLVRRALADSDPAVQQVAAQLSGLHRDALALDPLLRLLVHSDPMVVRAAAEALGRLGNPAACGPLLAAAARPADRGLEHSLIYALIEIGSPALLLEALESKNRLGKSGVACASLVALDQMALLLPQPLLDPDLVLGLCNSDDPSLREKAFWIAMRHPEWAAGLAPRVQPLLERAAAGTQDEAAQIVPMLARIASDRRIAETLSTVLDTAAVSGGSPHLRSLVMLVMQAAELRETPIAWVVALERLIAIDSPASGDLQWEVIVTLELLALSTQQRTLLRPSLLSMAQNPTLPARMCLSCLRILKESRGELPAALVDRLKAILSEKESPLERSAAASLLAELPLSLANWQQIAGMFDGIGSLEVSLLLPAVVRAGDAAIAEALDAIERRHDLTEIRVDAMAAFVQALPPVLLGRGQAIQAQALATATDDRERLESLAATLPEGNVARGHAVFSGRKSACTTCHAMAFVGGRVGPDLSKIGSIRTPRDLLEAIVLPSSSFVRSYESVVVVTVDGKAASGILKDEGSEEVILQTGPSSFERFPRHSIESMTPSRVSLMPKGYDSILSVEELADLVAFLAASR